MIITTRVTKELNAQIKTAFNKFYVRVALFGVTTSILGLFWRSGVVNEGPTLCLLQIVSGVPCPMCGSTRAVAALCSGDIESAIRLNPFGLVFFLIGSAMFLFPKFRDKTSNLLTFYFQRYPIKSWSFLVATYLMIWFVRT